MLGIKALQNFNHDNSLNLFSMRESDFTLSSRDHLQHLSAYKSAKIHNEAASPFRAGSTGHSGSCLFSRLLKLPSRLPGDRLHWRQHRRLRPRLRRRPRWYTRRKPRVTDQHQLVSFLRVAKPHSSSGVSTHSHPLHCMPFPRGQLITHRASSGGYADMPSQCQNCQQPAETYTCNCSSSGTWQLATIDLSKLASPARARPSSPSSFPLEATRSFRMTCGSAFSDLE